MARAQYTVAVLILLSWIHTHTSRICLKCARGTYVMRPLTEDESINCTKGPRRRHRSCHLSSFTDKTPVREAKFH